MLSVLSIIYLAVLAGCAAAVLLTAIMFLIKKKAGKPLALYALCVMALLGLGFLVSMSNPVPNPRHTEPEPVVVSPGSQTPPTPWAIEQKPAPVEIAPVEAEPADVSDESVAEPVPVADTVEDVPESNARSSVEKISARSSAAKISSAAPRQEKPQSGQEQPQDSKKETQNSEANTMPVSSVSEDTSTVQQSPLSLSESPTLASDPVYSLEENPQLSPEPTLATMVNPTLSYDSLPDNSQDAEPRLAENYSEASGSSPATYIHDFSNGRVLITTASDNNGDPVYHTKDCRAARLISPADEYWFASEQAAKADGRRLCGFCG